MILVLMGPPGVGKGTQAAQIAVHYGLPTISTGALFRDALARGTKLGHILKQYRIEKGDYVPDSVVVMAVRERIREADCEQGFLLDGFPRTIPQAEALEELLCERGRRVSGVLDFEAPLSTLIERFSGRRVCPLDGSTYHIVTQPPIQPGICDLCLSKLIQRPDDAPEVVLHRLEMYVEKTEPLLDFYRKRALLYTIDATAEPETIFGEVIKVLGSLEPSV